VTLVAVVFLPHGDAAAAPENDAVSCARFAEVVRESRLDCRVTRHDGVNGVFIGPASPTASRDASRAPSTSSVASTSSVPSTSSSEDPSSSSEESSPSSSEKDRPSESADASSPTSTSTADAAPPNAKSCPTTAEKAADRPGDLIDLGHWYLTLPTGRPGSPDTVENPDLATFTNEFFKVNDKRDGVAFTANAGGVTTKNSRYPRSELREMNGAEKAAWSNASGTHTLDVCEAITKVPAAKPEVVAAQIHDAKDDVLQIRLEGQKLVVQYDDGASEAVVDPNYVLGTPYTIRITAAGGKVEVLYNGEKKAELPLTGSGWYWKVGAYVQSNTGKGDAAGATGEVIVYSLNPVHA
jgi:Alginate lyase